MVTENILASVKMKNGYLIAFLVLLCTVVITFTITFTIWKTLLHIIIWHLYKGVIRTFYECLLLSLEFTIFINTIFQLFIFTSKSRNVSTFNLVLFYQTFSLSMTSFLFSGKKKKEMEEEEGGYIVQMADDKSYT